MILGFLTFTGSLMAAGKLQEVSWIPQRPVTYRCQNVGQPGAARRSPSVCGVALIVPTRTQLSFLFPVIIVLSLLFGVLLIIPIGGADMPTVISLLNSYAGLAAVAMGFVLDNKLLITAGALDGSSGLILSIIMCRAMNRSFTNVLFGAFGQVQADGGGGRAKSYKSETPEGAAQILEQAQPGGHRARLRHGGRAGPAPGARAVRPADQARRSTSASPSIPSPAACRGT